MEGLSDAVIIIYTILRIVKYMSSSICSLKNNV